MKDTSGQSIHNYKINLGNMSVLTQSATSYLDLNNQPHIDEYTRDEAINYKSPAHQLCALLNRHHVSDILGVTLSHRHFKVEKGNAIVLRAVEGVAGQPMKARVEPWSDRLLPYQWVFKSGNLTPIIFVERNFPGAEFAIKRVIGAAPKLLPEFLKRMKWLRIPESILGISLCLEGDYPRKRPDKVLSEYTDEVLCQQVYRYDLVEDVTETMKPVMWVYDLSINTCRTRRCCQDAQLKVSVNGANR